MCSVRKGESMQKKSVTKMRLHRETLRQLTSELQEVNAGVSFTCNTISACQPCTLTHSPTCA